MYKALMYKALMVGVEIGALRCDGSAVLTRVNSATR